MREKEKLLLADIHRVLKRYKDYETPYIRPDGDVVIPLDAFLKKSRGAHSKMADVFKEMMEEDPSFKNKSRVWVE